MKLAYRSILSTLSFVLITLYSWTSYSAAWPLTENTRHAIHTLTSYYMDDYYDANSDLQSRSSFYKLDYSTLYEQGISPDLTLGIKPSVQFIHDNATIDALHSPTKITAGLLELYVRKPVYQRQNHIISVQPLIATPSISHGFTTQVNKDNLAFEGRLLHGYNFSLFGYNSFSNTELAYRFHPYASLHSLYLDATLGLNISSDHLMLAQVFNSFQALPDSYTHILPHTSFPSSYDLTKLQLSYVTPVSSSTRLQLGGFTHASGRNTGGGGGLVFSLWHKF